jgi:hypothetical protein
MYTNKVTGLTRGEMMSWLKEEVNELEHEVTSVECVEQQGAEPVQVRMLDEALDVLGCVILLMRNSSNNAVARACERWVAKQYTRGRNTHAQLELHSKMVNTMSRAERVLMLEERRKMASLLLVTTELITPKAEKVPQ